MPSVFDASPAEQKVGAGAAVGVRGDVLTRAKCRRVATTNLARTKTHRFKMWHTVENRLVVTQTVHLCI